MARPGVAARPRAASERAGTRAGTRSSASRGSRNWSAAAARPRQADPACGAEVAARAVGGAALPLAPVAPAARRHHHAGPVGSGHRRARLLSHPADRRRAAAEQGEVRHRPGVAGPDRRREQPPAQPGPLECRSGRHLPLPDRAGTAERERQRRQLRRRDRGEPGPGGLPGLHPRRGGRRRPLGEHSGRPGGQRAGGAGPRRGQQDVLRADDDRVDAGPRQPARARDRHATGQLLRALLPVPHAAGAADPPVGAAHADRGRAGADRPAGRDRFAGDAVGGHPGPARGAGGAAADRRPP